jgi:nitrogen fixation NifU-like protein
MDYSEELLDQYKYPRCKGEMKKAEVIVEESNSSCGDRVKIYIKFDSAKKIKEISWEGEGCALSLGVMSMVAEKARGKDKKWVDSLNIDKMLMMEINPGRKQCAWLPIKAMEKIWQ